MAAAQYIERLTPLDIIMPQVYTCVVLIFRADQSPGATIKSLQESLDTTAEQLPWLNSRIVASDNGTGFEMRRATGAEPLTIANKGLLEATFEISMAEGMPPAVVPTSTWPLGMGDLTRPEGAPVFGASFFHFADLKGVGLCITVHHRAADANGMAEVLRVWALNARGLGVDIVVKDRNEQLSGGLQPDLEPESLKSMETLLAAHPEYTITPLAFPSKFPPCLAKVLKIKMSSINEIKARLADNVTLPPSSNTVLAGLLWSMITTARLARDVDLLEKGTSRLGMAVNGRKRIDSDFSSLQNPYFGNVVLYALAEMKFNRLSPAEEAFYPALAEVCDAISKSIALDVINRKGVAEVYALAEKVRGQGALNMSWEAFGSRDLTITSWADLDLYNVDFGDGLGRPAFVRLPHFEMAADGVCIILPRDRDAADEVVEVVVMLRKDDMRTLEAEDGWRNFLQ